MKPLRIHMIGASEEYDAAHSLDLLATHLERRGVATCTRSIVRDRATELPGLEALLRSDLLLIFCKRLELPEEDLAPLKVWCNAGRPIVGIRTASHAFQTWLEFDKRILGGDYSSHGPDMEAPMQFENADHPILAGVTSWKRVDKVYRNPKLAPNASVLIRSVDCLEAHQPLAWVRGKVFYTSIGSPEDFAEAAYLRLIENAVRYVTPSVPA